MPCTPLNLDIEFHHFQTLGSTNTETFCALDRAPERMHCVTTDEQTHGYGRFGRKWFSRENQSLVLSFGRVIEKKRLSGRLSLASAIAVADFLDPNGEKIFVKWPNDLVDRDHRKLAGILIESRASTDGVALVVGLGLNLDLGESATDEIARPVTDLKQLSVDYESRNALVRSIAGALSRAVDAESMDLNRRSLLHGRLVDVERQGQKLRGRVIRIEHDGALTLETDAGLRTLSGSEEVSLGKDYLR